MKELKKWLVTYYRYSNYITTKTIKTATAGEAIKKSRVKNIIDLEIIEE